MEIRKTKQEDLERLLEIYAHARAFMVQTGNPKQWAELNWPPEELIRKDIREGKSYVCEAEGRVVGTFFCDFGPGVEPLYDVIDGAWMNEDPYAVIHRIAGDGSVPGIGTFCINWVLERYGNVRISTHPDNIVMQNLMKKLGFAFCGTIHSYRDSQPRFAYEKTVDSRLS